MKTEAFVLIALTVLLVPRSQAETEIKGSPAELTRYLSLSTVTGEGEVKVPADRAIITVKVTTDNRSLADALRANDEIGDRFTEFLKQRGIGPDRVHASKFSSTPKHGPFSDKVKNQRVEKLIKITVRDEKEFAAVAAAPDKFPEVTYRTAEFEHSEKEKFRAEAVSQACDDADRHKQLLEKKLGLKLTARRVSEQFFGSPVSYDAARAQGGMAPSYASGLRDSEEQQRSVESVSFGELIFKVLVRVEYSSEPNPKL